jgi:hypothetical protein
MSSDSDSDMFRGSALFTPYSDSSFLQGTSTKMPVGALLSDKTRTQFSSNSPALSALATLRSQQEADLTFLRSITKDDADLYRGKEELYQAVRRRTDQFASDNFSPEAKYGEAVITYAI